MRYYGAKTKLLPFIEEVVNKTGLNKNSKLVDLFAGTSAVGRHFKKLGYTIISNDILEFSYAVAKSYIELNKEPDFRKLKSRLGLKSDNILLFDFLNNLKSNKPGFIFENYSPNGGRQYFTDENALKIDTYRYLFEEWYDEKLISELEYYYLITSLLKGINLVSNVSGTYAAYLKTWDHRALKPLTLEPLEIIESNNKNKAYKADANELIKHLKPDILYLDPPYNSRQYASNYFILELVAEGWFKSKPEIYGATGMRKYDHQKSKYCSKTTALNTFEDLVFNSGKAKYIILSYNNEGVINYPAIEQTLSRIGEVKIFTEEHKRYKSINQTVNDSQITFEHLFLVKPRKTLNNTNNLTGKEWLQNSFSIWRNLGKLEEEKKLGHPAIFTLKLVTKLIDTYCKPNGGLILDCFAGSGTTLIAGLLKDKDVIGFDLNPDFKKLFLRRASNGYGIISDTLEDKYIVNDSRYLSKTVGKERVDLCITSPPYWDILNRQRTADYKTQRNYSSIDTDLGNIKDYSEFIDSLKLVFCEVYQVLKPKGYFIVNVMDLRKKDKFYPLHIDAVNIAQEAGFSFEDIIIWDRQTEYNNMRPLGYPFKFIINKVHEYLLIFRKLPSNGKK